MAQFITRNGRPPQRAAYKNTLFIAACCLGLMSGSASAAIIGSSAVIDFTGGSIRFGYQGSADFTFSDVTGGIFFNPTAVGVSTSGGGAVTYSSFFGVPDTYFDPVRGSGVLVFDSSSQFSTLPRTTGIPFSASPFFIGLRDTAADGTHFGYGEFSGTELVSYAFQSKPGVGIQAGSLVSPVPLPPSAPMFGAALLAFGAFSYGVRRKKSAQAA